MEKITPPFKVGDCLSLEIERMSSGEGLGVGRYKNFVIFVENAVPEERLEVKIYLIKKRWAKGKIVNILKRSTKRVDPLCPVFGECGGCEWQHIEYQEQINQKQKILSHLFTPFVQSKEQIKDFVPSVLPFFYRNRIQIQHWGESWGFKKRSSHLNIATKTCSIAHKKINDFLNQKIEELPLGRLEIRVNRHQQIHVEEKPKPNIDSFDQVNESINQHIQQTLVKELIHLKPKIIIDAYCGNGNFSLAFAKTLGEIQKTYFIGLEMSPLSIENAKKLSLDFLLHNKKNHSEFEWILGPCEKTLPQALNQVFPKETVLFIDPPRIGCNERFIETIKKSNIPQIFYLSCDPQTQIRDIKALLPYYEIQTLQGFDMFPQTPHIESLVTLSKVMS